MPHNLLFVDYVVGHTGSIHDSTAFRNTRLYTEHKTIFQKDEWVWADSAYPATTWCVVPFKRPTRGQLSRNQKTFNYNLSRIRIRSEHAIGLLKGRFQSLRELRIQISSLNRHRWAIVWIRCCIILHNLIIMIEGDEEDGIWRQHLVRAGLNTGDSTDTNTDEPYTSSLPEQEDIITGVSEAQAFRLRVMNALPSHFLA